MNPKDRKAVLDGIDAFIKYCCYLGLVWIFLDLLKVLPIALADKLVAMILGKFGL
jgi:uncharacterized membrane protein (GlpM family)